MRLRCGRRTAAAAGKLCVPGGHKNRNTAPSWLEKVGIPAPVSPLLPEPPSLLIRGCLGAPWGPALSWFLPLSSCDPCAEPPSMKSAWMAGTPWCSSGPEREVGPLENATASDESSAFFFYRFCWTGADANVRGGGSGRSRSLWFCSDCACRG